MVGRISVIFVCCSSVDCGWLVMLISGMLKWWVWVIRLVSLGVLFEFDSISVILVLVIMFRLLWLVLVGWMNCVGVLVEVRVVVILCLIWFDLFMFEMMIWFLVVRISLSVWVKLLFSLLESWCSFLILVWIMWWVVLRYVFMLVI